MAALTCDLCGGKLQGKPGGVFECDSCGMEYNSDWAREKIQQIRGTVQVEGTVHVAGTVKVEGGETAESLIRLARLQISQRKYDKAADTLDKLESRDPEGGEAPFLRLMMRYRCADAAELANRHPEQVLLSSERTLLEQAERGSAAARKDAALYRKESARLLILRRQAEERRQQEEREEAERHAALSLEWAERAKAYRAAIAPVRNVIALQQDLLLGVKADGTLCMEKYGEHTKDNWFIRQEEAVGQALNIRQVYAFMVEDYNSYHNSCCGLTAEGEQEWFDANRLADNWLMLDIASWASFSTGRHSCVYLLKNGRPYCDFPMPTDLSLDEIRDRNARVMDYLKEWEDVVTLRASRYLARFDRYIHGSRYRDVNIRQFLVAGICADGSVRAVHSVEGRNKFCKVLEEQKELADMAIISTTLVYCLREDGTVYSLEAGGQEIRRKELGDEWYGIAAIFPRERDILAIRADGRVLGDLGCEEWENVVTLSVCGSGTAGLTREGEVLLNDAYFHRGRVSKWKLFDSLEEKQAQLREDRERFARRVADLEHQQQELEREIAGCKGLFAGRKKKELEGTLYEVNKRLNKMKGRNTNGSVGL